MRNLRYLALAILPLAVVWLFVVGQSMHSLVTMIAAAPMQPAVQSTTVPSSLPQRPREQSNADEVAQVPALATATKPSIEEAHLPPAVYADGSPGIVPPAIEQQPHPEITDPRIRKLLQPAWDD
jgi:hypothetical protein